MTGAELARLCCWLLFEKQRQEERAWVMYACGQTLACAICGMKLLVVENIAPREEASTYSAWCVLYVI
jgi:ferredoxin